MRKRGSEQVQRVEQILHGEEAQKSSNLMSSNKFRLSNMLPNSWLHKLKNMTKPKPKSHTTSSHTPTKKIHPQFTSHRHSYYFTSDRLLHNSPINPPRKSTKRNSTTRRRRTRNDKSKSKSSSSSTSANLVVTSSASAGCDCRASLKTQTYPTPEYCATRLGVSSEPNTLNKSVVPEFGPDPDMVGSWSSSCNCRVGSFDTDIIIEEFDLVSGLDLPPILTKPVKFNDMVSEIKKRNDVQEEKQRSGPVAVSAKEQTIKTRKEQKGSPQTRRISTYSTGLKLRSNTPRMKCPKTVSSTAKSLSDSFAIVKSSRDPQRDFRESMVEMIVENNIRASKDLEELLAYYLCLNSDEYHDIIVRVFEQIWFDLTDIQL